jgi:propionyl-CoA carboxylase alpha chain
MFDRILVANRGEIALRIIRTCRRLSIETVAVYSDEDTRNPYVEAAHRSVRIGGSKASESYLDIDRIVSVALETRCQAVHPGYGFLSENPRFAEAVQSAGLVFIGPPARALSLLGDKIAAKELAKTNGIPLVPGHVCHPAEPDKIFKAAEAIGYPLLVKPAAGGGGKGMRIVAHPAELEAALKAGRQETLKAFGDEKVFIEKYIEDPRHIEVQILADSFGNVVYLGERECSIQRRYQKLIEESPSPAVSEDLRRDLGEAACRLARAAGYVNAGTVEFIFDRDERYYFLEMNTRLQVEHPVTEMVTGLDLVELQLKIASGQALPFDQSAVSLKGWAMEARICAEDPSRGFLPSTGMITRYAEPKGDGIRVDSGIRAGGKVSMYYDSMLSKVISWGRDREAARSNLVEALNGYHIEGLVTNLDFLNAILCHPEFKSARLSTQFIERHFSEGRSLVRPDQLSRELAALIAALIYHVRNVAIREAVEPMVSRIGGRRRTEPVHHYMVRGEEDLFEITLQGSMSGRLWSATVNRKRHALETPRFEFYRRRLKLNIDGRIRRFRLRVEGFFIFVAFNGVTTLHEIYTPREWAMMAYMPRRKKRVPEKILLCPMPGQVVDVVVKEGDRVFRGQTLVVLESMKLESGVASPLDGTVEEVSVSRGQAVEKGDVLIRFKTE